MYVCVRRTLFCPVFHGVRPVPSTTSTGHFFPVSSYRPLLVRVRVRGSYVVLPSFACRASSYVHDGRRPLFFPTPRTGCSRVRVGICVRVCALYVVLPSFPWRASGSVHGGRRPLFPRVPVQAIHGAVYESVYVCLPHTWLCPILHGARPVPSTPVSCPFLPGRMLLRFLPVSPFT